MLTQTQKNSARTIATQTPPLSSRPAPVLDMAGILSLFFEEFAVWKEILLFDETQGHATGASVPALVRPKQNEPSYVLEIFA